MGLAFTRNRRITMSFHFNQLSQPVEKAILGLGFVDPTEIQKIAIPKLLSGQGDFVGQAQTGTGKTAAFGLPLLEKIDLSAPGIQAIILSPTRELANQINDDLIKFSQYLSVRTATVYGGVGYRDQIASLRRAQIVVATPGRAIDLLEKGKLKLENAQFLVIDEADEMLKMGFIEDVETIMDRVSDSAERWMFSATMPKRIVNLMQDKLNAPEVVRVEKKTLSNENITQSYWNLPKKDFPKALKAILLTEKDFFGIIFCETKEETKRLAEKLSMLNKKVVALHGDLNQHQRDIAMEQFKTKKADIMVCTDVAARGLDVSQVTHVINMGLPRKSESYVHRIGRTGRAGHRGKAISFVAPDEGRKLREIERLTKQKMKSFALPKSQESKQKRVEIELDKMQALKSAIQEKQDKFNVDDSYGLFQEYFEGLSKDQVMKLLFSYNFNSEFRQIDDTLSNLKESSFVPLKDKNNRRRRTRSRRRFRN